MEIVTMIAALCTINVTTQNVNVAKLVIDAQKKCHIELSNCIISAKADGVSENNLWLVCLSSRR